MAFHRLAGTGDLERGWPGRRRCARLCRGSGTAESLYLGTTNSWIYESLDRGVIWHRLAKLDLTDDLVLDHIVVDAANPATIYVAAWKLDQPGGGLWISHDGGQELERLLKVCAASRFAPLRRRLPDPRMLFAGTLEGVFRSADCGRSPGR